MEAAECGAASLGMVLGYFGRFVPLAELRRACNVSRNGSNALYIARAAKYYGLDVKAYRREPEDLRTMPLPQIVFWNLNHFVVIEGFGRDVVYLNDPATGRRSVGLAELDTSFSGVVLTFSPGPQFVRGGTRPNAWQTLWHRLRGSRQGVIYCVLAGVALVIPGLAAAVASKVFVDDVLVQGFRGWIVPLAGGLALAAALSAGLTYLQQRYLMRLNAKLAIQSSATFIRRVLALPMEFYAQRYPSEIAWRATLNDRVAQLLSGQLTTTLLGSITALFYLCVMFAYDPLLAAITAALGLVNLAGLQYIARLRTDQNRQLLQEQGKLNALVFSSIRTIETVKASGTEEDNFSALSGSYAKFAVARQRLSVSAQVLGAIPGLIIALDTAIILGIGGLQVMQNALTIGSLVAFATIAFSFMLPFGDFVGLGAQVQEITGSLERLDDVMANPVDPELSEAVTHEKAVTSSAVLRGMLELRGVTFGYSRTDPPLIERLDLVLQPGRRIALVGRTGSGKSTVSRLVAGLYRPWEGSILLDGRPRESWPPSVLADSVALVDQQIVLFGASVRENLTLWDETLRDAQIVRAAKDALIHEAISARPKGYDGEIIESGANYSGGERQRLEIARALARDPALVVLDEATSALDPVVEFEIDQNLRKRGCGCLIVAHRLSTIRDCDEIIVLDNGKVAQRGTHEQLKDIPGPYADLIGA